MRVNGEMKIHVPYKPILVFDEDALARVQYMIKKHPEECQWWHCIKRLEKDGHIIYYLEDLFIPEQWVGGADVESDDQMWAKMWMDIGKERKLKGRDLNPLMQTANAWCHSHHTMPVNPSGTDDTQWKKQKKLAAKGKNPDAVQIMVILNKKNECFNRIWDPILGVEFEKVPIRLHTPAGYPEIDAAIELKFKKKPKTQTPQSLRSTGPIKSNGHTANCSCVDCVGVPHTANCYCITCTDKKKSITSHQNGGGTSTSSTKKNMDPNSTRDPIGFSQTGGGYTTGARKGEENNNGPFYFSLSENEWNKLERIARHLCNTPSIEKSHAIAQEAMKMIDGLVEQEDMFVIYHLLKDQETIWTELEEWYFCSSAERTQQQDYRPMVLETLTTDPISPSSLLPRVVQFAMRLGAMSDLASFGSVVADYYEKYHPEHLSNVLEVF